MIKAKWGPEYKVSSQKIGLKFSKNRRFFRKWVFLHKNIFTFYVGLLVQRPLEVSPWVHAQCTL